RGPVGPLDRSGGSGDLAVVRVVYEDVDGRVDSLQRRERLFDVLRLSIAERVLERDLQAAAEDSKVALHGAAEIGLLDGDLSRAHRSKAQQRGGRQGQGQAGRERESSHVPTRALRLATVPRGGQLDIR